MGETQGRTEEEVVGVGALAADAKELEEVPELAVDVAADLRMGRVWRGERVCAGAGEQGGRTDGDGRVDPLDVGLLDEDLAGLEAEVLDLLFRDGLAVGASCVSQLVGAGARCARCRTTGTEGGGGGGETDQFLSCSIWLREGMAGQRWQVTMSSRRTHRSRLEAMVGASRRGGERRGREPEMAATASSPLDHSYQPAC